MFDKVIVAIGHNSAKRGLLTPEARKRLIEQIYNGDARVEVTTYSTLTGDEARRVGATTIIRSVRNATAFDYERTMDHANREIFPELRTIIVIAPAEVEHISSSLVRELRAFGHDTSTLLPQGITLEDFIEH
jgi:pantetheine-phosphate adenylyltransferase